jgi:hypothetical protein
MTGGLIFLGGNMAKLTLVFVGGEGWASEIVKKVTDSRFSHVAVKILDSVWESQAVCDPGDKYPGIWLHPLNKYDNNPNAVFVDIEISAEALKRVENKARKMIGTFYGYSDCLRGGLFDLLKIALKGNGITANCSEGALKLLRVIPLNYYAGIDADCITPGDLYRALA